MTKQYDPENFLIRSDGMTDEQKDCEEKLALQESISKMEQELEQMKQRVQEIK